MSKTQKQAVKRRSPLQGCLTLVVLGVVIFVIAAVIGAKGGSSSGGGGSSSVAGGSDTTAKQSARAYITKMRRDINTVQVSVQSVQVGIGLVSKDANVENVDQFAQLAQQAHDFIDGVRDDFATGDTSGNLGNAEVEVFSAANDLKNAMGAVVAYTGNPNPATLAHFSSQYQNAVNEWNDGIQSIWNIAGESHPPTV